ncbi:SdpI family protein [Cellulomonas sp. IC4_254]|uniref:SdpI family protein n=1 Tax=Cellulomonas sp. IC4_254 TaxID=2714040 RepID=UPI00142240A8|nr:SdpI family protein [Cellulomonas sp. IC4_254]NHT17712.1 SdpI family protein [Cellulomonas sp. IC4_254]
MNWPAVILSMTVPAVLVLANPALRALAPKRPNMWIGYRTRRAMRNQENWSAAQLMSARLLGQIGIVVAGLMAVTFLFLARTGNQDEDTWYSVGLWAGIAVAPALCWVFSRVEAHLKALERRRSSSAQGGGGDRW